MFNNVWAGAAIACTVGALFAPILIAVTHMPRRYWFAYAPFVFTGVWCWTTYGVEQAGYGQTQSFVAGGSSVRRPFLDSSVSATTNELAHASVGRTRGETSQNTGRLPALRASHPHPGIRARIRTSPVRQPTTAPSLLEPHVA